MFWELIGAIALGVGAGGFALALRKITRGLLPGWIVPVAAGLGMIGYSVYMDYAWSGRTRAALPEGLVVVESGASSTWFKPWTYVIPPEERLAALDVAGARSNADLPGLRLATLYFYDRSMPPGATEVVVDCPGARLGRMRPGTGFGPDGKPQGVLWQDAAEGHAMLSALCG